MSNIKSNIITDTSLDFTFPKETEDYGKILHYYGLQYEQMDYYYQVGTITKTQGWILHISVVISQVTDMLQAVMPELVSRNFPFKIPMDNETSRNILNGLLGVPQIGKLVSIYPENENLALSIAKKLIALTESFQGPSIPTDVQLGNALYTRYGSFNPVLLPDINGKEEKYIYNKESVLIKDSYTIPFVLPQGINWPFSEITNSTVPVPGKTLKGIYRPVCCLKEDPKGNVFKGVYLKSLFQVRSCVIKQGKKNMSSEDSGRNIYDRLVWQQQLYHQLANKIPLPEIIDLFEENGDHYLVMEYIKGDSLSDKINKINPKCKSWFELDTKDALLLLRHLEDITAIIEKLHENGFVHRDIVPVNFLIDKNNQLFLIDLELSYSIHDKRPTPPFTYGTAGFMSPEQQLVIEPTTKEDIYGLGALMLQTFTGLTPIKFDTANSKLLFESLYFFICNHEISSIITSCLNPNPKKRPALPEIKKSLNNLRIGLQTNSFYYHSNSTSAEKNITALNETISAAINGLNKSPVLVMDDLWYSKMVNPSNLSAFQHMEYTRYPGLDKGIAGVLYLLARAKKAGFDVDSCMKSYTKGWEFIKEHFIKVSSNIPCGFYSGSAGVALAFAEGINAGLLLNNENNRKTIQNWLELSTSEINFTNGITGQSCAIMQCSKLLNTSIFHPTLCKFIDTILNKQQKDGSWLMTETLQEIDKNKIRSFRYGIPGIIWMLLEYGSLYKNYTAIEAAHKALRWILKNQFSSKSFLYIKNVSNPISRQNGMLITLIKAYDVLQEKKYMKMTEDVLLKYPSNIVRNNFTQENGLAGMGEVYLEAALAFKNEEWKSRAEWIANLFIHTLKRESYDTAYWKMEERNEPTADFMEGISGIIHFLIRCNESSKIGYRLLS